MVPSVHCASRSRSLDASWMSVRAPGETFPVLTHVGADVAAHRVASAKMNSPSAHFCPSGLDPGRVFRPGVAQHLLVQVVRGGAVVGVHRDLGGLVELDSPDRRQECGEVQDARRVHDDDVGGRGAGARALSVVTTSVRTSPVGPAAVVARDDRRGRRSGRGGSQDERHGDGGERQERGKPGGGKGPHRSHHSAEGVLSQTRGGPAGLKGSDDTMTGAGGPCILSA